MPVDQATTPQPTALLVAASDTLRHFGPRRFSLTAVAEAAGVSRGTVHNVFGTREGAITTALNHLATAFIDTMAAAVHAETTLADQVAAVAVLISEHRRQADSAPSAIAQSVLILLLQHSGDDLMQRSLGLWKPLVKAAQRRGEVAATVDPARASEWIVRLLFSFELLPPIGVNVDNSRAVRRFVSDHIVTGLTGSTRG